MGMIAKLTTARTGAALVAATVAAILAMVLVLEHGFGVEPCALCYVQRAPYWGALAVALALGAVAGRYQAASRILAAVLVALFAVSLGLGVHHMGVERFWWPGPDTCSAIGPAGGLEALRAEITGRAAVRCDEVSFTLFGLSLATLNAVASLGLGLFSAALLARLFAREPRA